MQLCQAVKCYKTISHLQTSNTATLLFPLTEKHSDWQCSKLYTNLAVETWMAWFYRRCSKVVFHHLRRTTCPSKLRYHPKFLSVQLHEMLLIESHYGRPFKWSLRQILSSLISDLGANFSFVRSHLFLMVLHDGTPAFLISKRPSLLQF